VLGSTLAWVTASCTSACVLGGASAEPTGTYELVWADDALTSPDSWCQPGWEVESRARPVSTVLSNPDDDLRDRFACTLGIALGQPVPAGAYQITLVLFDAGGAQLAAAGPLPVAVEAGAQTSPTTFRFTLP
jgi:hypothetical protein